MFFADVYSNAASPPGAFGPFQSFYGGRQDDDLSDTVAAGHMYAGLVYPLYARAQHCIIIAWIRLGATNARGQYASDPMRLTDPDYANHN